MKKVLIVGASSCLGSNLARYLREHYSVYGTWAFHPIRVEEVRGFRMILNDKAPIEGFVDLIKPDAIVYCAAVTDLATCEKDPKLATFVNAHAAAQFANVAARLGARFIYLSSSKVFSGKDGDYSESDIPSPVEHYGQSKLRGEEMVGRFPNAFILRLGTVFALGGLNQRAFLSDLLRRLWKQTPTRIVNDEYRSFVPMEDLSRVVGHLIDAEPSEQRLFHLGSPEKLTHYEFALKVCQIFELNKDCLEPLEGLRFHAPHAVRQPDLHLISNHLDATFFLKPQLAEAGLRTLHAELLNGQQ